MSLTDWNDRRLDDLARDVEALRDTPAQLAKLTEAVGNHTKSSEKLSTRLDNYAKLIAGFLVSVVLALAAALLGGG